MLRKVKRVIGLLGYWVIRLKNIDWALCIFSALLLILSFPRSNYWIFAWVGFVPLFFALKNKSKLKAFLLAYLSGVIFWAGIIYWLGNVTVIGTVVLVLYLALYFGIFGICIGDSFLQRRVSFLRKLSPIICIICISSVWVILEYLRSHLVTGFPWALLGYSQSNNLPVIQIANITGAYGVSFLVVMVNVVIYLAISHKFQVASKKVYLSAALILLFVLGYGYYSLRPVVCGLQYTIKISVVQPNISQELKWDPNARAYILKKYSSLTESAAQSNPDLIVWPEAASPEVLGDDDFAFDEIFFLAQKLNKPLLIGAVVHGPEGYFNSALLIDAFGQILQRYNKIHLVPFGEYIPLKKYFPFLETIAPIGDINRGKEYVIFKAYQQKFSVLICFEDVFPELSREFVRRGAGFLINVTNDAWYKYSSAGFQHFQSSIFRAVENNVYVIRSANTGVSGFIAPTGRIISLVKDKAGKNIFVEGFQTQSIVLPEKKRITFYTKYGDIFVLACFLFVFYCIIFVLKKKK